MAGRVVVWTETAAKQRREILNYWTERNKSTDYAKKLLTLIKKKITVIQKHPETGKEVDFPQSRVAAMGHFSIFYQIKTDQLIIIAFWDNRQDPRRLLALISK